MDKSQSALWPVHSGNENRALRTQIARCLAFAVILGSLVSGTFPDPPVSSAAQPDGTEPPASQSSPLAKQALTFRCVSPVPGLVGWWSGDGHAFDFQNQNHGLLTNGASYAPGQVGPGFLLDGRTARVIIPDSPALNFSQGADFSIEAWIKAEPGARDYIMTIVDKRLTFDESSAVGYVLFLWDGRLGFQLADAPLEPFNFLNYHDPGRDLRDGLFHHVAVTVDRDNPVGGQMYVDGKIVLTFDPTARRGDLSNHEPLRIGNIANLGFNGFFKGVIDEVALHNRVLTAGEIEAVVNAGEAGRCRPSFPLNDGIPGSWREKYFGPGYATNAGAAAVADPDGDGASNYQEFLAGTDPIRSDSVQRVPLRVTTYAGSAPGHQDGPLAQATFNYPAMIASDARGRLFVLEANIPTFTTVGYGGHSIRMIDTNGIVSTLAGSDEPGLVDGPGAQARFRGPNAIVFDRAGTMFVTDRLNHRIRRIDTNGIVSTFAGSSAGYRDGIGANAQFYWPIGLTIDAQDNLYVADFENIRVRKVTPQAVVTTYAGSARGNRDGPVSQALFESPSFVASTPDGTIYVADWLNGALRKISTNGIVSTLASGLPFTEIVALDPIGDIYVSVPAGGLALVKFKPDGTRAWRLASASGYQDGPVSEAKFTHFGVPYFLPDGDILIPDGHRIRKVMMGPPPLLEIQIAPVSSSDQASVILTTVVTNATIRFTINQSDPTVDSPPYAGPFSVTKPATIRAQAFVNGIPVSSVVTQSLLLPFAASTYTFTTLAGSAGNLGSTDGFGSSARFNFPAGVAADSAGNVYMSDLFNHTIRKITPTGTVSTLAGLAGIRGGDDGTGSSARFNEPNGVAVDSVGNVYVGDTLNHTIRKITPDGVVSTLAGLSGSFGATDGIGSAARFSSPQGVAVDTAGNVYVADDSNHRIRKITPVGVVSTLAGSAPPGSVDGPGSAARFNQPLGVAVDSQGNIYVADANNAAIRKIAPDGMVSTLAGLAGNAGATDGTASQARFYNPVGVAVDRSGNVYVADGGNNTIRKITPGGMVSTLAGLARSTGSTDGIGSVARFNYPYGVAVDSAGNVYVADAYNNTIRKGVPNVAPTLPTILEQPADQTVLVGSAVSFGVLAGGTEPLRFQWQFNAINLPGANSSLLVITNSQRANDGLYQVLVSNAGGLVSSIPVRLTVVLPGNSSIPILVTTVAGTSSPGAVEGRGVNARFNFPNGGFVGPDRMSYIADAFNHRIRRFDLVTGDVATLAGAGFAGYQDGSANTALFNVPQGVVVNAAGEIFVADALNHRIRKINADTMRTVTTVAGSGVQGYADGPAPTAQFSFPNDLVLDAAGNLYVSEFYNHTIRKITPAGAVLTVAGNGTPGSADGIGSAARLNGPAGLAIDQAGNLYVTEWQGHRVRKITPPGAVTTLAGNGSAGFADGTGGAARFNEPDGIVADPVGNLYVAEHGNHVIRKVAQDGRVTTVAGTGMPGLRDGEKLVAQFNGPGGIGWDRTGNLVVADTGNHSIRLVNLLLVPQIFDQPQSQTVTAGGSVRLQVTASGPAVLRYQWYFNGTFLFGTTNSGTTFPATTTSTLTLTNVQPANAGIYAVIVANSQGASMSQSATLTVLSRTDFVQRDLPQFYMPGYKVTVRLDATPLSDATAYAVEDSPPVNWAVSGISDGGFYDAANRKVKFGPFFDSSPRSLSYVLTPPLGVTGRQQFSGTVSSEGQSGPVSGDLEIDLAPMHPADRSPADFRVSVDEVTAYGAAWRKGTPWPQDPNPIPIDFLTRAGALWRNGENYFFNSAVITAPLWWENFSLGVPAGLQQRRSMRSVQDHPAVTGALSGTFVPTELLAVEITVRPAANVAAYAVQDQVPAGWMVKDISHGGEFDAASGQVKWGPYFDNAARTLRYQASSGPNKMAMASFRGVVSFDGVDVPIPGPREVRPGSRLGLLTLMPGGQVQINVTGWSGENYELETSTDLMNWAPLGRFTNINGVLRFNQPEPVNPPQRFYRVAAP
jgi:sugar lactone lactonase YvrE